VSTALHSTHCKNWKWRHLSTDRNPYTGCTWIGYNWFSHTVCYTALWESPVEEDIWQVLVNALLYPIYILLIPHIASSTANMCMWQESEWLLFQITILCFKCMSGRLSPIWISMLIFLQCSERLSIAKTIHEMNMCKLVNLGIFVPALFLLYQY
jgi:hypothetical protein